MKNTLSYVWKAVPKKSVTIVAALVASVAFTAVSFAGFGPDRPTQAWTPQQNGFQYVTFNSYTGVPNGIGDERDFLRGVQVGRDSVWSDPVNSITNDAEIEAKIFIHNNADPLLNDAEGNPGIARNVNVRVELPTGGTSAAQDIKATISASNAQPQAIFDTLGLTGVNGSVFQLAFVPGSAKMVSGGQTTPISDSIVTSGVTLPDQKGCFEYVREITFRVKVQKPGYQVRKSARLAGEGADKWRETVNAKRGDKVEWRIFFQNIGSTQLNNVKIVDDVPPHMTVVPGSVEVVNSNFPNGYKYPDSSIQANGRQVNIDIDDYAPQGGAYVYFATTIDKAEEIRCGTTQLQNVAYATPEGYGAVNDGAFVNVLGEKCEPNQPQYACKAVNVTKLGGRKVKVDVSTLANPSNRVQIKNYTYNFGDGSTPLVTTDASREYTFAKDGTFKISVKVTFTVDGTEKSVEGAPCEAMVTFGGTTPPTELPNTGVGSMVGLLAATTVAGAVAHRFWTLRKN